MEKWLQRTEIFTFLSLELTSIVDLPKLQAHFPSEVLLGFMYCEGTLIFGDHCIGVEICRPYPTVICLSYLKCSKVLNFESMYSNSIDPSFELYKKTKLRRAYISCAMLILYYCDD